MLPSGDSNNDSLGNNNPTERITLVVVGVPVRNQLGWVKLFKEDWALGTNTSSLFREVFEMFDIAKFSLSKKIAIAAPKILYLDTYTIFYMTLHARVQLMIIINMQKQKVKLL